jgi:hypothetical protein
MSLSVFVPSIGDVALTPTWPHAGAPSNGTSGTLAGFANKGDLLVDVTNAVTYQNTNTQASPTWTQLGTGASVAITGGTIDGATIGGTTPEPGTFTFARQSYAGGLVAVGTSRTNALVLTAATNRVITAASAAVGVVLPASATVGVGGTVVVINDGPANAFHVYAAGSDTIDAAAGSTGVDLTNAFQCVYQVDVAGAFISYRSAVTRSA